MNFLLAANWAALGILYNTGQDCTAGSRLYVQDTIYDKFVTTLAAKAKELIIGDGFDEKSGGGPVVRTGQTDTLLLSESDHPSQGFQNAIRPCLELYRIREEGRCQSHCRRSKTYNARVLGRCHKYARFSSSPWNSSF